MNAYMATLLGLGLTAAVSPALSGQRASIDRSASAIPGRVGTDICIQNVCDMGPTFASGHSGNCCLFALVGWSVLLLVRLRAIRLKSLCTCMRVSNWKTLGSKRRCWQGQVLSSARLARVARQKKALEFESKTDTSVRGCRVKSHHALASDAKHLFEGGVSHLHGRRRVGGATLSSTRVIVKAPGDRKISMVYTDVPDNGLMIVCVAQRSPIQVDQHAQKGLPPSPPPAPAPLAPGLSID